MQQSVRQGLKILMSRNQCFTDSNLLVQGVPDVQGGGAGEAGPKQVQHHLAAGQPAGADPPDRALPVQQQVTWSLQIESGYHHRVIADWPTCPRRWGPW